MASRDSLAGDALLRGAGLTSSLTAERAIGVLRRMHSEDLLKPIPEWPGGIVDGYMDILGLNDRPIRGN